MAKHAPQGRAQRGVEWAEASRLCANSQNPWAKHAVFSFPQHLGQDGKYNLTHAKMHSCEQHLFSGLQNKILLSKWATKLLSPFTAKLSQLWQSQYVFYIDFYCLGISIRGFVVCLSLQQDCSKLSRTPPVSMQVYYLHCICTSLVELTSYHTLAMRAHRSEFRHLNWLHGLGRVKNKEKTLKLVTTQLWQIQISGDIWQLHILPTSKNLPKL